MITEKDIHVLYMYDFEEMFIYLLFKQIRINSKNRLKTLRRQSVMTQEIKTKQE